MTKLSRGRLLALAVVPCAVLTVAASFGLRGVPAGSRTATVASPVPSARPSGSAPATPAPAVAAGCAASARVVSDATQLQRALTAAAPGDTIVLAAGTFSGRFAIRASGTPKSPITLCGPRQAVIDGGDVKSGYVLHLDGASWWRLTGFTVQGAQKGVMADHANHDIIASLFVHGTGDEAIHLRAFSSDNTIEGVMVRDTGLLKHKFGEGIYVGSAYSNWCKYSSCSPDMSDRNTIRGNDIAQTTAENIDIKEGTTGGTISGNRLSGVGMDSAASTAWINVKGNAWTINANVGDTSPKDGFQVHRVYSGWGENNVFRANQAAVNGPGFGFYVQSSSLATQLSCDNVVTNAGSGSFNTDCS